MLTDFKETFYTHTTEIKDPKGGEMYMFFSKDRTKQGSVLNVLRLFTLHLK
jgi:hypothetical protein